MKQISSEAKTFNAMLALVAAAEQYKDYLVSSKSVNYSLKHDLNAAFRGFNRLHTDIRLKLNDNDLEVWLAERKTDAQSFAAVMEHMAELTQEGRDKVEAYCVEMVKLHGL